MADVLIIGGGVIGLSLAWELAQRGPRVRVVDQGAVGREASWAGAGILPPAGRATAPHPLAPLERLAHGLHPVWSARLREATGIDDGYRRCGGLHLGLSAGEAASLAAVSQLWHSEQIACERLAPDDLARLEPALARLAASGAVRLCLHLPDEAQIRNPWRLAALAAACRAAGVELCEQTPVHDFTVAGGRVTGAVTSRGVEAAGQFVVTAGAWSRRLLEQLGVANAIEPIRGQMVLFRAPTPPFARIINEGPRYLVPRDDGHVLAGSTEEEVGFDKSTTAEALAELTAFARRAVPALEQATIERSWAGLRPGSEDGFPYMGPLPGWTNAFVAAGHFRSGLNLSPAVAVELARRIVGQPGEIDLRPFQPLR